jgi:hypothetical protein
VKKSVIREFKLRVYTPNGKLQAKKSLRYKANEAIKSTVNELVVLKLQCIIILLTQKRKYETFNENFAKKI